MNAINGILKRTMGWLPARWALALLCMLGTTNFYMVRVNLAVTIVAMVKSGTNGTSSAPTACQQYNPETNWNNSSSIVEPNNSHAEQIDGEFEWSEPMQGVLLGSFFYGYLITQVPGGRLSEVYGGKWIIGLSIMAGGICAILTPLAAKTHFAAVVTLRIIQGFVQGVVYPAMFSLLPKWTVPNERSKFLCLLDIGINLGLVLGWPLCGWSIANYGWESAFYVTGCLSLLWCIMWFAFMYNTPEEHPRISAEELEFIKQGTSTEGTTKAPDSIPWRDILTSPPFWGLLIAFLGLEYGFTVYVTALPTYMKNIMGLSISQNGLISALPIAVRVVCNVFTSIFSDWLLTRKYLTLKTTRKLFLSIALFGIAGVLGGAAFSGCSLPVAIALLCIGSIFMSQMVAGPNKSEFAPNFTGTLQGIINGTATIVSLLVPLINGFITDGQQTIEAWQIVFLICIPVHIIPGFIFLCLYTTDVQPWNFKHKPNTEEQNNLEKDIRQPLK
ncbi:unnamed protein product [Meganyctiphanes norvegica]|uniref:Major facilitator superfamily (MFS) profile domain-containing protein n=1 Tax=Meganyctiphanes norvegica TaxID=48144 RepID=A0AAV2R1P8_MEGNR